MGGNGGRHTHRITASDTKVCMQRSLGLARYPACPNPPPWLGAPGWPHWPPLTPPLACMASCRNQTRPPVCVCVCVLPPPCDTRPPHRRAWGHTPQLCMGRVGCPFAPNCRRRPPGPMPPSAPAMASQWRGSGHGRRGGLGVRGGLGACPQSARGRHRSAPPGPRGYPLMTTPTRGYTRSAPPNLPPPCPPLRDQCMVRGAARCITQPAPLPPPLAQEVSPQSCASHRPGVPL